MLIGAMNHPSRPVEQEIQWMAEMRLEFIDLTLEPPLAASWNVNPREIRRLLEDHGLGVVGHTAYYLPLASVFEGIRKAVVEELKRCLEAFSVMGARWMNLHPDPHLPMHERSEIIQRNLKTYQELEQVSADCGVGLMIENLPGTFNNVRQLEPLFEAMPRLGFHLDIGHANLMVEQNTADELMAAFSPRLRHVHLHDNKGGNADLHLPLGAGTLNYRRYLETLACTGYDGTITLEVFSTDKNHLTYSRDVLKRTWTECLARTEGQLLATGGAPREPCCAKPA